MVLSIPFAQCMWLACGPDEICAATDACPERVLVTMARVANPGSFTFSVSNAVLNAGIWEVPLPPGSMIAQIDADGNITIAVSSVQATDVPFAFSQNVLGSEMSVSGTATVATGSFTGSLDPGSGAVSLATSLFASITFTATIIGGVVYSGTCSIGGSAPADQFPVTVTTGPPGTPYSQQTGAVTLAANLGSPIVCDPALPAQLGLFTDNIQLIIPGTITPILRQGTPVVTGVAPGSGSTAGGTLVMVTGSAFTGATGVGFGAAAALGVNVDSDTQITATSPPGAGTVDVTVTTSVGTSAASAADQFTYVTAPAVTEVFPASAGLAGGTVVTVTGSGFTGAIMVGFGGVPGTGLNVVSDTQLTVTSPPGTFSGPVDVMVTTPTGVSAIGPADQFTYVAAAAGPVVTVVFPASGGVAGGTVVTVTGGGFTGAIMAGFGGVPGTGLNVVSDTQLTVTSPPGAVSGPVDVMVATPVGTSEISPADQFTYV